MKLEFEYGQGLLGAELPDSTDIFIPGETVADPPCLPQDWDSLYAATLASIRNPIGMPPLKELAGISMAGRAVKIKKDDGGDILTKLEEMLTKIFKGAGDAKDVKKTSDADDAKKDDITPEDIAELAKQLEDVSELKKENEDLKKRVDELEKSTIGKQSRATDKGSAVTEDYSDLV